MWPRKIHFEFKELLGEGSQGCVYRALRKDPGTGLSQTVAVKILHSETTVNAWKIEFDSLARVRSEYCVKVHGFERLKQRPALILEYIEGASLAALGKGCWLDEGDIQEIMAQAECALLDLHRFGSFHGDLSPQNILIDTQGHLRLLDFGLANCSTEMSRATPEFASPERLCGERADLAADIFSLGRVEQFLRGIPPGPDPMNPYLQITPSLRSMRGLFPEPVRRRALAKKIAEFRHRQKVAKDFRTRTQICLKSLRPSKVFLRAFTALSLLFVSGAATTSLAPRLGELRISTYRWHRFKLDGRPIGYAPLSAPLEAGRSHRLEWESAAGRGTIDINSHLGGLYRLSDRDFSH